MLERGGLVAGRDFFLAFSPERVDPANAEWHTGNTPKVVGGIDQRLDRCREGAVRQIVDDDRRRVLDERRRDGEAAREHVPRRQHRAGERAGADVPADEHRRLGSDRRRPTKPFGFMAFYPGPGLGGHCIPIDPFYLSWKARQSGFESRFIELAGHINAPMPRLRRRARRRGAQQRRQADQGIARAPARDGLQGQCRRLPRVAGDRHRAPAGAARRRS